MARKTRGPRLTGKLLGGFDVSVDGTVLSTDSFERPSGARVLKLLLVTPDHRVRREVAAEQLWPDADPERSSASLRKAVHFARRAFETSGIEAPVISGESDVLLVNQAIELDLDIDRLRTNLAAVRSGIPDVPLDELAALGGRELLPDDPYEEWLVPFRERLRQDSLSGLMVAAQQARQSGRDELATRLARATLEIDSADELAHRLLIELALGRGELHAARRQLLECTRALASEYGVEPSPELVDLINEAASTRAAAPQIPAESPIVGRRREIEAAEPSLDAVAAGRLGVVVYIGPAGIGKSRVMNEVARSTVASGWLVLALRGIESSPDATLGALGSAVANALRPEVLEQMDEPARSAILTIAPSLGPPSIEFATDEALLEALLASLEYLGRQKPLVIAADDLQWLDAATVYLLSDAVDRLSGAPVLLLATVRDGPDPVPAGTAGFLDAVAIAGAPIIRLGPLPTRELAQILERELADGRLEPGTAEAISGHTAGAPLFALELLRSARDHGALVQRGATWRLAGSARSLPVPRGARQMLEQRTQRLEAAAAATLRIAAELGDEITLQQLIIALGGSPESSIGQDDASAAALDALDVAIAADILVERGDRYAFAHPLFRAALRSSIRPAERASLHLRVARALASGIPMEGSDGFASAAVASDLVAMASHASTAAALGKAEAVPLAIRAGFSAAERLAGLFDHDAAIETMERALEFWRRLPPDAAAEYNVARALRQLGWARHAVEDEVGAIRAFRTAASLAREDSERALAWSAAAWMPYQHGRFDEAEQTLREALQEVKDDVGRASLEADRGWIRGRRGDWDEAYAILSPAIATLEAHGPTLTLARSLVRLAVSVRRSMNLAASIPIFQRSMQMARQFGDERLWATAQMHLAGSYREMGKLDAASAAIEAALRSCLMTGDRYIEAVTIWTAAEIDHARGDYDRAIELRRRELALLESIGGNQNNQAMAHAHIAYLAMRTGDTEVAEREAETARSIARLSGLPNLPGRVERALASDNWFVDVTH